MSPSLRAAEPSETNSYNLLSGVGGVVALYIMAFAWSALVNSHPDLLKRLDRLGTLGAATFAAVSCLYSAYRMDRTAPQRWLWSGVGWGALAFAIGQGMRVLYAWQNDGLAPEWISETHLGFYAQYALYIVAAAQLLPGREKGERGEGGRAPKVRLPFAQEVVQVTRDHVSSLRNALIASWDRLPSTTRAKQIIDTLLVMVAGAGLGWVYAWEPIMGAPLAPVLQSQPVQAHWLALAYPLLGLGLLSVLACGLLLAPNNTPHTSGFPGLVCGLFLVLYGDFVYASLLPSASLSTGRFITPPPVSILWVVAFGVIGYAAWRDLLHPGFASSPFSPGLEPAPEPHKGDSDSADYAYGETFVGKAGFVLPYLVAVLACIMVVARGFATVGAMSASSFVVVALLFLLLTRRQILLSYNNRDIAELFRQRVEERTRELSGSHSLLADQHRQLEAQSLRLMEHHAELEEQGSRLDALHRISVTANASLDPKTILRETLREIVNLMPRSWGGAYLLNENEEKAQLLLSFTEHVSRRLRPPAELTRTPYGMACLLPPPGAPMEGHNLLIPLMAHDHVMAVMQIGSLDTDMTDDDLTFFEAMGSLIGAALENARLYQRAKNAADRDPLTGLLNHRALQERLEQEIARARRENQTVALIVMDLNNFKLFNETYGHTVGDKVILKVAAALREVCRQSDVFGRHGGDEFLAILPGCVAEEALQVAERINEYLANNSFTVQGEERIIPVGVSAGIAVFPQDGRLRDNLLAFANENIFESKLQGGRPIATTQEMRAMRSLRDGESFGVLDALVAAVDNKDSYTRRHADEVTRYCVWMAESLQWKEEEIRLVRIAGLLHDVGKIGVPDSILRKPQRLNDEEEAIMRQHSLLGAMLLASAPDMASAGAAVRHHHERWDGRGYPDQLAGEGIPLLARLMAVADAYSAMTTDRPYRKRLSMEVALEEIIKNTGIQFDPQMVKLFLVAVAPRLAEEQALRAKAPQPITSSAPRLAREAMEEPPMGLSLPA